MQIQWQNYCSLVSIKNIILSSYWLSIMKVGLKKADLFYWWDGGNYEIHPCISPHRGRAQALCHCLYMLISSISLALYYPTTRKNDNADISYA